MVILLAFKVGNVWCDLHIDESSAGSVGHMMFYHVTRQMLKASWGKPEHDYVHVPN